MKGTHIVRLRCKNDDFVELGNVTEEIIHPGSLCCPPALVPLVENQGSIDR